MKRTAISLFVCFAIAGWAGDGHAKRGKKAPSGAEQPAEQEEAAAAAPADEKPAEQQAAPAAEAPPPEPLDLEGKDTGPAEPEPAVAGGPRGAKPTTLSWQDIVVVPRKPFLKSGRLELEPFTGVSINDILIRHYAFGLDLNYFLTDVFWVGLQGQYYVKALTERQDLIGLQYNRIPTLNRYLYGGALNFGYVPVYGKFAFVNKWIIHWEIYASAGVGYTKSEILPRVPGNQPFSNDLLTANAGLGSRFFLFNWLTINFQLRDYIFPDRFENVDRPAGQDAAAAKAAADQQIVHNVMFMVGAGIYLPTGFNYRLPR